MQKLMIDTGVEEFELGGGVLRFNPGDPNVYHRFFAAEADLQRLDEELRSKSEALTAQNDAQKPRAAAMVALLAEYDERLKALLTQIFGAENDFDALLQGVNLAAVGANGQRVVQNLLEALTPILQAGAKRTVQTVAEAALADAEQQRTERGQTA